jgi:hypothetical protein
MDNELSQALREERRRQELPPDAKCACGEIDVGVLVRGRVPVICYECLAVAQGKSGIEADHFGGRANSNDLYRFPANDHRRISDMQEDWIETLRNPDHSPLIKAAAVLRAWRDYMRLIIERSVGWVPQALEALDRCLTTTFGARWWESQDFAAFTAAAR